MMGRTRWLRIRLRPSIGQAVLLAACISYYFRSLPWVRQGEKQAIEGLDTGDYLKNSKIRFDCLTQSLAPPSALYSKSLSFPPQQGDSCWSGKVGQKVVSVCALQLPQLSVTCLGCQWPGPWGPPAFVSAQLPDLQDLPHLQDPSSTEELHLLALLLAAGSQFSQNHKARLAF